MLINIDHLYSPEYKKTQQQIMKRKEKKS